MYNEAVENLVIAYGIRHEEKKLMKGKNDVGDPRAQYPIKVTPRGLDATVYSTGTMKKK